ncbi:hypothetical protein P3T76_001631 [Phytophthora citrophthora]|uniref:Uncharacterized protein n=1 Tax=Phytophthora citrophthora TaxID=4793 RepID=A0AAD9GZP7_9STRA|nr:hypothetical protein P3T76_001631 [Phytophthora citrophthora]
METLGHGSNTYWGTPEGERAFSGESEIGSEGHHLPRSADHYSRAGSVLDEDAPNVMTTTCLSAMRSTVLQWTAGSGKTSTEQTGREDPRVGLGRSEGQARWAPADASRRTVPSEEGASPSAYARGAPRQHTPYSEDPFGMYPPEPPEEKPSAEDLGYNEGYYDRTREDPERSWRTGPQASAPSEAWSSTE